MEREASAIPANIMRTMPYTSYVAVASYAAIFLSKGALWLLGALIANEVLNAGTKWLLRRVAPEATLLRRPDSAMDSGIYPQHYPRPSTTSGMPSGHAQTAALLLVLLAGIADTAEGGRMDDASGWGNVLNCLPWVYLSLMASAVMVSRTRFGGSLAVRVDGRIVAHHTVLQVLVGAALGACLGLAAWEWYAGRPFLVWLGIYIGIVMLVALAAIMDARTVRKRGDKANGETDSELSTEELSSDRAASTDETGSTRS